MNRAFAVSISTLVLYSVAQASLFHARSHHHKEKIVWQENFNRKHLPRPDPAIWTYDEGSDGWGNGELEVYCAYGSTKPPCDPGLPNVFVGNDGYLHIVARRMPDGRYTSARLKTQKLKSFQYGRFEARIRVPAGKGMWPAFWLLGEDIDKMKWPASGELDVMEHLGRIPDTVYGSIHGTGFTSNGITSSTKLPDQKPFADGFHNFGMIWQPNRIAFYVDDPDKPYAVETPKDLPANARWPFEDGPFFVLLNLAVGGGWPGNPDASTSFPSEMLVDSIKIWELHP